MNNQNIQNQLTNKIQDNDMKKWLEQLIVSESSQKQLIITYKIVCDKLIDKISQDERNDEHTSIHVNQVFKKSVQEVSIIIFQIVYANYLPILDKNPQNIIGFYTIIKFLLYSQTIMLPQQLKKRLQQHTLKLLFTKVTINQYQQIFENRYNTQLILEFTKQLLELINQRIKTILTLFNSNIERQLIKQIINYLQQKNNQNQLECTIDQIILCRIYITYLIQNNQILFGKICQIYQFNSQIKLDRTLLLKFYNQIYLRRYLKKYPIDLTQLTINNDPPKNILGSRIYEQENILNFE